MDADAASAREEQAWTEAVEESELLTEMGQDHDQELFLGGQTSPMIFASAMLNFGVRQLLETLVELAPSPVARAGIDGEVREPTDPFSAVVFKVQAGMDSSHRDRLAFMRIVSGEFERGMVVTHAQTGKPFATKYAQAVFGRDRSTVDTAFPGDVVGLVNATALRPATHCTTTRAFSSRPSPRLRPSTSRRCVPPPPTSTSSSARVWTSSTVKASCRCCATSCAATPHRFLPPSVRCSSRSSPPA